MGITKRGNKRVERALKKWQDDIINEIKRIIKNTTFLLEKELKARMPHETGEMAQSINVKFDADGYGAKLEIGVSYAIYVNYGTGIYAQGPGGSRAKKIPWVYFNTRWGRFVLTHGQRAQFFWEQAVDEAADYFIKEFRKLGK